MSTFVNNNTQRVVTASGTLTTLLGKILYTNNTGSPVHIVQGLLSMSATATAGSRNYALKIVTGTTSYFTTSTPGTVAASVTQNISFGNNVGSAITGTTSVYSFPHDVIIMPGDTLWIFDVSNIDVNDVVNAGNIVIQT